MFCNKCGSKISENDNFCKKCGSPISYNNQIKNDMIKKRLPIKLIVFMILALVVISTVAVGVYFKLQSQLSVKSSSNKVLKISTPIPTSNFVKEKNVVFKGNQDNVTGWCSISHRKDGLLPTTINLQPQQVVIELFVLIQNNGDKSINLEPQDFSLVLNNDKELSAFKGEKMDNNFDWLSPEIIELNGKDISKQHLQQIDLSKHNYCVVEVSFPMNTRASEKEALSNCKKVECYFKKSPQIDSSLDIEKVK